MHFISLCICWKIANKAYLSLDCFMGLLLKIVPWRLKRLHRCLNWRINRDLQPRFSLIINHNNNILAIQLIWRIPLATLFRQYLLNNPFLSITWHWQQASLNHKQFMPGKSKNLMMLVRTVDIKLTILYKFITYKRWIFFHWGVQFYKYFEMGNPWWTFNLIWNSKRDKFLYSLLLMKHVEV